MAELLLKNMCDAATVEQIAPGVSIRKSGQAGKIRASDHKKALDVLNEKLRILEENIEKSLDQLSQLNDVFEKLEQNPEEYLSVCVRGDAQATINLIEKCEVAYKEQRKHLNTVEPNYKEAHPSLHGKLKELDENIIDIISLMQECRWRIMLLHARNRPRSGSVYNSAKEAIADLWD